MKHKQKDTDMANEDRKKALEQALGQIEKTFGKGSIMKMGENLNMSIEASSTGSLALDMALGVGGVPKGRVVEIYGPESSGKSTLALHIVAEAQRNGGTCAYIDAEHALDPIYARAIGDLEIKNFKIQMQPLAEKAMPVTSTRVRRPTVSLV